MGFIGESGARKSTTISLILDELKKDNGQSRRTKADSLLPVGSVFNFYIQRRRACTSRGMKIPPCTLLAIKWQYSPVSVSYQSEKGTRVELFSR